MTLEKLTEWDIRSSEKLHIDPKMTGLLQLAAFFAHSGDSWFWLFGLFLVWLLAPNPWHTTSALMAIGVLTLAVAVLGIKLIVRRQRPEGEWGAIYRRTDPHSFPSGHAARAFLFVVLAFAFAPLGFAIILLIWAPLVCLARVLMGVHYLSDVIVGAVIGILWGIVMSIAAPMIIHLIPFLFH
jgi:membrane-associated phospholipid phosphatase